MSATDTGPKRLAELLRAGMAKAQTADAGPPQRSKPGTGTLDSQDFREGHVPGWGKPKAGGAS